MRYTTVLAMSLAAILIQNAGSENEILQQLTDKGLEVTSDVRVQLPAPTLADGLDAAAQQAVIDKLAVQYTKGEFVRKSVVAPLVLKMQSVSDPSGARIAQRVDLWFVAHGKLKTLHDEDLLNQLVGGTKQDGGPFPPTAEVLSEEELKLRGLSIANDSEDSNREQWYVNFTAPLLDRVQVSGVMHAMQTMTADSIVVSGLLDERFSDDKDYPTRWRPIERKTSGEFKLGEPRPYTRLGGYVKATALAKPAGALLIECHVVFQEPYDWFGGANLLRSKLPIAIQDDVRTFRRRLAAAEKAAASDATPEDGAK